MYTIMLNVLDPEGKLVMSSSYEHKNIFTVSSAVEHAIPLLMVQGTMTVHSLEFPLEFNGTKLEQT